MYSSNKPRKNTTTIPKYRIPAHTIGIVCSGVINRKVQTGMETNPTINCMNTKTFKSRKPLKILWEYDVFPFSFFTIQTATATSAMIAMETTMILIMKAFFSSW